MKFTQWESVQVLWRSGLFSLMRSQRSWHSLLERRLAGENWSQLRKKKHAPAPYGLNYLFHASRYSPRKFLLFSHVHTEHSATCFVLHFVQHIQHEPIMVATLFTTRVFLGHSNAEVAGLNTVWNVIGCIFSVYLNTKLMTEPSFEESYCFADWGFSKTSTAREENHYVLKACSFWTTN